MTAFTPFPTIPAGQAGIAPAPERGAETRLAAAVLRLAAVGAADRVGSAFGTGPGTAILAARDRFMAALGGAAPDPDALAVLAVTALDGPDGMECARPLALGLVPAHRMQALVLAARDFGLALRRAVVNGQGAVPHACAAAPSARR
ncbi:hypothetical protein ACVDG3_01125 [Meridianimarinicoccus sp. RP-17]